MSKMGTKKLWPAAAAQVHPAAMTPFWVGVHSKRPWSAARRVITLWDKTWIEFLLLIKYNKPWINNKHSEIRFSNSKYKLPRNSQLHIMMVESYQQTWHLEKKVYNYSKGQFSRFRLYYDFFTSTYLTNFKIFSLATDFWKKNQLTMICLGVFKSTLGHKMNEWLYQRWYPMGTNIESL